MRTMKWMPWGMLLAMAGSAGAQEAVSGRWYTHGGNAARSGASANAPLLRRPVFAWRVEAGGEIVGEPLVWDDHVVLGVRVSDKRAGVEVRRLRDGGLIGSRILNSTTAPEPALWGNEIVWRVDRDGLELTRFDDTSVAFVRRMAKATSVASPVRIGTDLFAVIDGKITCMRAADFRVLWQSELPRFLGPFAAVGKTVVALRHVAADLYEVVAVDADSGKQLAASARMKIAPAPAELRVLASTKTLTIHLGAESRLTEFRAPVPLNTLEFTLPLAAGAEVRPASTSGEHVTDGKVRLGMMDMGEGAMLGLFPIGSEGGVRLDTNEHHRKLTGAPPTIADGVLYLGACAVELERYRVLWQLPEADGRPLPAARAVPAGRTLLLAQGKELVALREDLPDDAIAAELATQLIAHRRERGMQALEDAIAARDVELATALLGTCREFGAPEAWVLPREKKVEKLRADKRLRVDEEKAAAARQLANGAAAAALDAVHETVRAWLPERPAADVRSGLRFVLGRDAEHQGAHAVVRTLLPAGIEVATPLPALDWLDFLEASATTEVSFLEASLADFERADLDVRARQDKQQLLEWRSKWRADLKAVQSRRLLLFSPITAPGSLAKALAAGELVCDALESMFADMPVVRQDPRSMLVFIYPDRDEYLAESRKLGIEAGWTAGYYSDSLNELVSKSRMFVPSDDRGFVGVLPTLAHELTHHWLMDRCPAFVPDAIAARVGPKSFWIVEGFASLVGQFEFDFARSRFHLGRGSLDDADIVVAAAQKGLIPWDRLVGMRRVDFDRLVANERPRAIDSRLRLGTHFEVRGRDLFYAQSAMLARYLYEAEDGRHRRKLLEFVVAYYTGNADALDFPKAFGETAATLGPKVIAFAQELLR